MKIKINYILTGLIVIILLVSIFYLTNLKNQVKNVQTNSTTTTSFTNNSTTTTISYLTIKNFTYSIYFKNVNWSKYSNSSCTFFNTVYQKSISCYKVTSLINTSSIKLTLFFKNTLNTSLYLNNNVIELLDPNPENFTGCGPLIINPSNDFNCTVILKNNNILPKMSISRNFEISYCYKSCNNTNINYLTGSFQTIAVPYNDNTPFNYTYAINLTKPSNSLFSYSGTFQVPINLTLENVSSLTSGFYVENVTPNLPLNFTGNVGKTLHIAIQLPNTYYDGNLALKLVYSS